MKLPFPLQEGEQLQTLARRHWLFVYPKLAAGAAVALVPVGAVWWAMARFDWTDNGPPRLIALAATVVWLVYWVVRLYFLKYRYDNDIWVVTNQRVIDSVKNNWFHLQMSTADLVDIEDMSVIRSGLLGTMFDFGDINCQTAGEVPKFSLRGIPQPREVQALVDRLRDESRQIVTKD
jgi:membrane protein YdbS with pleckstrin-like domain